MRTFKFDFHPEQIRVTPEEILADLRYPASPPTAAKAARKPRDRRQSRR